MAVTYRSSVSASTAEAIFAGENQTTYDDWPGLREFADLGRIVQRSEFKGINRSIEIGFFEAESGEEYYVASSRPHVVGLGATKNAALIDWFETLVHKREMFKSLRRPFAATVENDFDAIMGFFGILSNGV